MKEKKYTYPRVHFERELLEDTGEVPLIQMIFTSIVINRYNEEEVVQLISFYPYEGVRDGECEMDSADTFHHMCREAYFADEEDLEDEESLDEPTDEDKPLDEGNISFNEDDERW